MRRLAIPFAAIFVAVAAWAGIASALAGGDAPPTNGAGGYQRHAATAPSAPDQSGPRVDAAVQLEPLPPPSVPAIVPLLAPVVAPQPARPAGSTTHAKAAEQAPVKQTNITSPTTIKPATDAKTGTRKEAERHQQFDRRHRERD